MSPPDVLGVEPLCQRGRTDHVEEQDRHLLELLVGLRLGRGCGLRQGGQPGPRRRQHRVDDGIAQHRPLRFQRGDAGLELLLFG